jgi:hypothetical protein
MSIPKEGAPFPAVVLVHGSGPQDRDETIGPNKPFRDLAWALASRGIAVLRYDKRTFHYRDRMDSLKATITPKAEVVDDALQAVDFLQEHESVDNDSLFVLGHSLGGQMVPRIGKRDSTITGFIIMASTTRPLEDIMLEQFTHIYSLDGEVSDSEQVQLDKLAEQVEAVKSPELSAGTPGEELPLGVPGEYWLDLRDYDPAEMAAELPQSFLILQGGRDYQVTVADFEGWKQALGDRDNVEFKLYPDLNHLFLEGEGISTPQEYAEPGHIPERVIKDLTIWIKQQK